MLRSLLLAGALLLAATAAQASDCAYPTAGRSGQCYPTMMLVDPTTGLPTTLGALAGTVTANLGNLNGAALDTSLQTANGYLGIIAGAVTTTGAIASNQVSVASTATQIIAARALRTAVTIVNHGTTDVFLGPSGVTATTGALLPGAKGASITIQTNAAVFGITGTGTQTVSFVEAY